ncbi:hypothetical protein MGG_17968 [Pyricularia oryzae 70-15]|uniref:Uncharacterized protein n=1 Tax=Pyricularia oryzae (strain 70-15 / ATCC MYA-4617 / FGSC 8958) TaxID=242507 RepID=G4NJ12_PYRO7|nr:uncharacterized protein MGG_17968 [Pyricularia oryzae 70-15]EHA46228.1 hypothetical protein MGG_17968 [Pyricularia oryzae 70-15]
MLRPLRFLVTAVPPRISLKTEIAAADDSNHHHNRKLCCNFHSPGRAFTMIGSVRPEFETNFGRTKDPTVGE